MYFSLFFSAWDDIMKCVNEENPTFDVNIVDEMHNLIKMWITTISDSKK